MVLLLASPAGQFRNLQSRTLEYEEADVTSFNAFELLVQVVLPQNQSVPNRSVLVYQVLGYVEKPVLPVRADGSSFAGVYLNGT